jgi:HlyD family secretion protein
MLDVRLGPFRSGLRAKPRRLLGIGVVLLLLATLAGCGGADGNRVQGYVEGEFVYVASPLSGAVESLAVQRGDQVRAGDLLFALESTPEKAARDEAVRRLAQARATWEDLKKPRRPSEIESLDAQLRQAQEALAHSQREVVRQEPLIEKSLITPAEFDRARTTRGQDRQRVAQLEAELQTARLGAREDQIEAAQANVRALEAALAKVEWDLAEKHQAAPQAALVFDTLFREGEWVPAGRPVVALLPPQNIKVRAFVPETRIGAISVSQGVAVTVDGVAQPFRGKVSFISPRAEFTPPVIYSRESRAKLVFMVEAVFEPEIAAKLHPGQPVDVEFQP